MKKRKIVLTPEVLRLRDFRVIALARFFVASAFISQDVVIGWQIYSITKNTFMLGLTGLAEAVPALICALFAGHIVDISRPYRIGLACIFVMACNSTLLMLVGGSHVALPGGIVPWLFAGIVVSGLARAFIMPSSFALLPRIVPRALMPSASAFLAGSFQCASVAAPALAGIIYGGYGVVAAWFIPMSLMLTALSLQLFGLSAAPRQWRSGERREPAMVSIVSGWKFILTNRTLLTVMAIDMFAVLFGGAVAMLPAYADQILHVGSEGLGALRAAPALGAITVALILSVRPLKVVKASTLLLAVSGFGLCMIGFGASHVFWLSIVMLALSGAFDSVSMVIRGTLMQWLTPDDMRGRVSSVNAMFIISSNQIGAFESGTAAKLIGLVPSVVLGGVATLVVAGTAAFASPKFRRLQVRAESA